MKPEPQLDPPPDYCEDGEHRWRTIKRQTASDGTVFYTAKCMDCGEVIEGEE